MQGMHSILIMTSDSLSLYEEHDITSQNMNTILDCMPQLLFQTALCVVSGTSACRFDPNSSGQLVKVIVYIIPLE